MARFSDIVLVLCSIVNSIHASYDCKSTEYECEAITSHCIPKSWVCDGLHDCLDRSDEAHCDYATILDETKRIYCHINHAPVKTPSTCTLYGCVWEPSSSTCFHKWARASGGLKCKYCIQRRSTDPVQCFDTEGYESCDVYLPQMKNSVPGIGDINDQRCVRIKNQETVSCGTAQFCEENQAYLSCCNSSYCNSAESIVMTGDNVSKATHHNGQDKDSKNNNDTNKPSGLMDNEDGEKEVVSAHGDAENKDKNGNEVDGDRNVIGDSITRPFIIIDNVENTEREDNEGRSVDDGSTVKLDFIVFVFSVTSIMLTV